ncbi:MAG: WYL domain-containing protein [Spirochaetaceae bacterium]|jgi:predicted DNA-binding transcriptional regulator YafY|nr:WYL domain-containing protein [Spirochaetaceae bacterium]
MNEKNKNPPISRSAWDRFHFIDSQIQQGGYPNTVDLAHAYGCSTATIGRDIEFMRHNLHAPIIYDFDHKGFYYEKNFRLSPVFAKKEDILALSFAKNLLAVYSGSPLYDIAHSAMDIILSPFGKFPLAEDRIVAPLPASYPVDDDIWNTIIRAMSENRSLSFKYQSVWNKPFEKRAVKPFQLLFDVGAWYLYGYSAERGGRRMFSLSRIKDIKILPVRFTLPADYDYRIMQGGSYFGVYAGDKKYNFSVKFTGDFVLWAKERKWADDQTNEDTPDGVIVSFSSTQYAKVLEWTLSKGAFANPLKPAKLVTDWKAQIAAMRKNAGAT